MPDEDLAWRCEQACANAWPGVRQVLIGDWVQRIGAGLTRRANALHPLVPAAEGLASALPRAEALCRGQGLPLLVRLPSLLGPEAERLLERRGFAAEGETLTLLGALPAEPAADPQAVCSPGFPSGWLAAQAALQGYDPARAAAFRAIVGQIALPLASVALRIEGGSRAQAFGVLDGGLLCIEAVIVAPAFRRQGLARRCLRALFAWAAARGGEAACLQVQADNAPAIALYRGLGLRRELYRYHYRRAPAGETPAR